MKIGWVSHNVDDYIPVNKYFKCSKHNHRLADCRGEEICLCTGRHKLRECTSSQNDFKCTNCTIYNKNKSSKYIGTNHYSLNKNCPNLQALLVKYKQNTDY